MDEQIETILYVKLCQCAAENKQDDTEFCRVILYEILSNMFRDAYKKLPRKQRPETGD